MFALLLGMAQSVWQPGDKHSVNNSGSKQTLALNNALLWRILEWPWFGRLNMSCKVVKHLAFDAMPHGCFAMDTAAAACAQYFATCWGHLWHLGKDSYFVALCFFLGWELSPPPMFSLSSGFGYNSNWLASMARVLVRLGSSYCHC